MAAVNRIPFSEPDHPFSLQVMYAENPPFQLDPAHPAAGNRWGYVNMGYGMRKQPRYEDGVTFDDDEPDYRGFPNMTIEYELTEAEQAEIAEATERLRRAGDALGTFVAEPRLLPNGSSLHYQGTMRMGEADDGTSVADPWSRVWGYENLVVGGNALIPTATTMNPTLMSVAIAVRGARAAAHCRDGGGGAMSDTLNVLDPLGAHDPGARQRAPQLPPAQRVADDAARGHRALQGAGGRGPPRARRRDHRQVRRRDRRLRGPGRLLRQGRRLRRGDRAALLKFVHDDGKGIVWFHGSAAQEDDWGYPEEYNVMRGAKLSAYETGSGRGPGARPGSTPPSRGIPITEGINAHVDRHRGRHPHRRRACTTARRCC